MYCFCGARMQSIERDVRSFTDADLTKMQKMFSNSNLTKQDIVDAWNNGNIVRIADAGDYKYAFYDFAQFEDGFEKECKVNITYEEFVKELEKGYGKSVYIQIARLFELSNGIWYDNEYVS